MGKVRGNWERKRSGQGKENVKGKEGKGNKKETF